MAKSSHLDSIFGTKNQVATAQIVFVDIVKYSQRKSSVQSSVVDSFSNCCREALLALSKEFTEYAQKNDVNFDRDTIKIPTGDGALFAFLYEGLPDAHLRFALKLLEIVHSKNESSRCEKFTANGWCNCHPSFLLRCGISEGKSVLYRDLNGNYNIAGNAVNFASRTMSKADGQQILLTAEAYKVLVDLVDSPTIDEKFRMYSGIEVKHEIKIDIYQYIGEEVWINKEQPVELSVVATRQQLQTLLAGFGFPVPELNNRTDVRVKLEGMLGIMEAMSKLASPNFKSAFDPSQLAKNMHLLEETLVEREDDRAETREAGNAPKAKKAQKKENK